MKISYAKLNTGKWGVRALAEDPFEELPAVDAEVTVTKKNGEQDTVKLTRLVWQGDNDGSPVGIYALDR